jgi:hypothetical protein
MKAPAVRVGISAAALAAAVALFFLLARGDDGAATARPQPAQVTTTQPLARSSASQAQSATAKAKPKPQPRAQRIFVRAGRPAGGVRRFEFRRGERVRFAVYADAADEVHIHGFDITKALPARRLVSFAFPADIEGVFEVELHGAHTKIAELRIRP